MHKSKQVKKLESVYANAVQLLFVGGVTGAFSGAVVTLFMILAEKAEVISRDAYAFVRENPAFLPLLVFVLLMGAFFLSVASYISSVTRGCGIPQAEGGARGSVRFRWWRDTAATFGACLLSILLGLSIGSEGPSALIGACVGDGVASCTHRNEMIKRYQITGGACTGLAVASHAPLTGIIFAFKEAHKRFTPEVFICAFSSVVVGMLTKTAIYDLFSLQVHNPFHSFAFSDMPFSGYGFVVLAGIVSGLLGVVFYKFTFLLGKLFQKIKTKQPKYAILVRLAIAVLVGGLVSWIAEEVMGGGHALIESLGTLGGTQAPTTEDVFGMGLMWTLVLVLLLKFIVTGVNLGSGLPCGIFIPMLAIGACLGSVLSRVFLYWGMPVAYSDIITMICMAGLFASIVKAPLTAVVMVCEFTGGFQIAFPAIVAVLLGYFIGDMFRTSGIYEELLEVYEHEMGIHTHAVKEVYTYTVARGAIAEKREVRDVLWPHGARVTELWRGEEHILPVGDTMLLGGDKLTIVCHTAEHEKVKNELAHLLE